MLALEHLNYRLFMNWETEKQQLEGRVRELEELLEESTKREENAAKLNHRLLDALNQIAR
jgi:cell division protein FtsB